MFHLVDAENNQYALSKPKVRAVRANLLSHEKDRRAFFFLFFFFLYGRADCFC